MDAPEKVTVRLRYGAAAPADMEIRLFANLCEVSPETVERLHMADYARLQDAYQSFLA